jgi:hypothetical protein
MEVTLYEPVDAVNGKAVEINLRNHELDAFPSENNHQSPLVDRTTVDSHGNAEVAFLCLGDENSSNRKTRRAVRLARTDLL